MRSPEENELIGKATMWHSTALKYLRAHKILLDHMEIDRVSSNWKRPDLYPDLGPPDAVCLIFSLECYIKTLITLEGKEIKKIHNLKELLEKELSCEQHKKIKDKFKKSTLKENSGLRENYYEEVLEESKNLFMEWRYMTSGKGVGINYQFCEHLIMALEECIQEIYDQRNKEILIQK